MILNIHVGFPSRTLSRVMPLVEESCVSMIDPSPLHLLSEIVTDKVIWSFLSSLSYAYMTFERMSGSSDKPSYK